MSDDQADERWSVRGVPAAMKEAAAAAAKRRGVSVGEFVCVAIDRELRAERQPMDVLVPRAADNSSDMSDRLNVVARVVEAATTLAREPGVPKYLRSRANRLLREALPEPRQAAEKLLLNPPPG